MSSSSSDSSSDEETKVFPSYKPGPDEDEKLVAVKLKVSCFIFHLFNGNAFMLCP